MPSRMKMIGRYGNGLGALFFASLALYALSHGDIIVTLFWSVVGALAGFNVYMFEKVAPLTSDERLGAELRTMELRRSPEAVVRNHGP